MAFTNQERLNTVTKILLGNVLDADAAVQWYESLQSFGLSLDSRYVWTQADLVKATPAVNLAAAQANCAGPLAGIVEDRSLVTAAVRLTAVPGLNNTFAALSVYGDWSSEQLLNWVKPQFAPLASGLPSFGYAMRLYNGDPNGGGVEVMTTDGTSGTGMDKSVGWVFNYDNGILLLASDFADTVPDPYITAFRYVGTTAGKEIEGMDPDHTEAKANPVGVGGVYLADPGADPLDEGDIGRILVNYLRMQITQNMGIVEDLDPALLVAGLPRHFRLDELGRLIVSDTSAGEVEGVNADSDAATANPVIVGGEYRVNWNLAFLANGDTGRALINSQRMFVVENRTYDAPTDADRVVPVVQAFDNHEPFVQSVTVATAAIVTYYFDARTFPYWSMQWSTPGVETVGIVVSASNETTEPDLTLREYVDVTSDLYGGSISLSSASDIALSVDTPLIWDSYRIQYAPSGATTWTALGKKGSF